MSENNVTGIIGATVGIGQYIINDYVITLTPIEGDYGYIMTITRGSETQTVTLYGLSTEQYNAMLGYLEQAQAASTAAQSAADAAARSEHYAGNHATRAIGASQAATASASTAEFDATRAETAATSAGNAQTAAETAASNAATAQAAAASAAINADNSQIAAEAAATRAEDAERNAAAGATNAQTYAGQAQQNATNAGQSAASAAQTLTQVQAEGASQIAAIDAEGQRVIDSIPSDYTQMEQDVTDLKSQMDDIAEPKNVQIPITIIVAKYMKSDGTINDYPANSYMVTDYIDISGIDSVCISGIGDFAHGICAFYDSNKSVVSVPVKAASGRTKTFAKKEWVTVPDNAVYMVIASIMDGSSPCYPPSAFYSDKYKIKPISQSDVENLVSDLSSKVGTDNVNFLADNYTPYNLTVETSKYIKGTDGTVASISGDIYTVADDIDVEGKTHVRVSGCATFANGICAFYTSNHTFISFGLKAASGATATIYSNEIVAVPSGAKYMAVASMLTNAGTPVAAYKDGYKLKKWTGLKWVCIGDSLTEHNSRTTMNYHDYIAKETGITVVNLGKSGSGYKRVGGSGDNFYQRALTIPTDADVVTVFGSGNDSIYMSDADLGTAADTGTDTIGGCVNTCIDNIYSRIPAVQLGIVAPTPWDSSNPADTTSGWSKYVELLRQICRNRSIPFLDLFHESNLRPWDSNFLQYAYTKDGGSGVHPDETGHKLIAGRFRVFVDSLLGVTDAQNT